MILETLRQKAIKLDRQAELAIDPSKIDPVTGDFDWSEHDRLAREIKQATEQNRSRLLIARNTLSQLPERIVHDAKALATADLRLSGLTPSELPLTCEWWERIYHHATHAHRLETMHRHAPYPTASHTAGTDNPHENPPQ